MTKLDKALERYTHNAEYERTHGNLQGCLEFRQLAEWIKELKKLREQTRWIPVIERLPESDGSYLLFGKVVEDDAKDIFIGMYDSCAEKFGYWEDYYDRSTLGFLDSELIEYNKVIAWMPLPKPYTESEG